MSASRYLPVLIICASAVLLVSCAGLFGSEDEKLSDRASNLQDVAIAVQGFVAFGEASPDLTGEQLIQQGTIDNPALLTPFKNYFLTARREGQFSSVLLCDKDRRRAYAEDAGCTATRLDARWWVENPAAACKFQIDLAAVCSAR
jgi:hypothetical protein